MVLEQEASKEKLIKSSLGRSRAKKSKSSKFRAQNLWATDKDSWE